MNYYNRDGTPTTMMKWANSTEEFEKERRVGLDVINGYRISTVFLGIDHSFGSGPPILFETMIFIEEGTEDPLKLDNEMRRYHTEAEAKDGHAKTVAGITALTAAFLLLEEFIP